MDVIPIGPKRDKLSNTKVVGNIFNLKWSMKKEKYYKKKKIKELNYKNKIHFVAKTESTNVVQKGGMNKN